MKGLSIESYTPSDFPSFKKYIQKNFHDKYILANEVFLHWQYETLAILKAEEGIIGHFGYRDIPYIIEGDVSPLRVLMNLYVEDKYRLAGAGALITHHVTKECEHSLVLGLKPAVFDLLKRIRGDWEYQCNLTRYFAVINKEAPLYKEFNFPHEATRHSLEHSTNTTNEVTDSHDTLWNSVKDRFSFTAERSSEYLRWRYIKHPHFSYSFINTFDDQGQLSGYLIYRIERTEDFSIARIVDCISKPEYEKTLFKALVNTMVDEQIDGIDFMFSGSYYRESLVDAGFFNVKNTDFEKFAIRFSPLSYGKLHIDVYYTPKIDSSKSFITKADGDMDRPNPQ